MHYWLNYVLCFLIYYFILILFFPIILYSNIFYKKAKVIGESCILPQYTTGVNRRHQTLLRKTHDFTVNTVTSKYRIQWTTNTNQICFSIMWLSQVLCWETRILTLLTYNTMEWKYCLLPITALIKKRIQNDTIDVFKSY